MNVQENRTEKINKMNV